MSHWDSQQRRIIRWESGPWPGYPGWRRVDCGCCNGLEWGGEYPRECNTCKDGGWIALHVESGMYALYPGGPAAGSKIKRERITA